MRGRPLTRARPLALIAVILLVAAAGGGSQPVGTQPQRAGPVTAIDSGRGAAMRRAGSDRAAADSVTIYIRNVAYEDTVITVRAGTVVKWINEDPLEHTVTAPDGSFDSGLIEADGGTFVRLFAEPGVFPYACGPHPFMTGRVVVRAALGAGQRQE